MSDGGHLRTFFSFFKHLTQISNEDSSKWERKGSINKKKVCDVVYGQPLIKLCCMRTVLVTGGDYRPILHKGCARACLSGLKKGRWWPSWEYHSTFGFSYEVGYLVINLFYSDCSRRWSFMFFPKSFQNLSLNCKSLLFSSFCHSELQMPQVISWQICFDFKLLLKSHYSNIFVVICCW